MDDLTFRVDNIKMWFDGEFMHAISLFFDNTGGGGINACAPKMLSQVI